MNKILEKVIVYLTKDGAHVINVDEDLFFKVPDRGSVNPTPLGG